MNQNGRILQRIKMTIDEAIIKYGEKNLWCKTHDRPFWYSRLSQNDFERNNHLCIIWQELPQVTGCVFVIKNFQKTKKSS